MATIVEIYERLIAERSIRKPGDVIYVNGTDIVLFDDCSGRIAQVLTAQDSLSYNQQMGYNIINL